MKTTGIIRCIDHLGRFVVPIEMRRTLDIAEGDPLEVSIEGKNIIIKKHEYTCVFCDSTEVYTEYNGKRICRTCLENLRRV